jgi:hypothetical protein
MREQKNDVEIRISFMTSFLSIALPVTLLLALSLFISVLTDTQVYAAGIKSDASSTPSEAKLGVPIYPGSTYDARNSQGMSSGGFIYYIFVTKDTPEKVASFYEQKLKVKAGKFGNSFMIPLKGSLPMPEEGISIQPNTLGGQSADAKTMITIQRQTK